MVNVLRNALGWRQCMVLLVVVALCGPALWPTFASDAAGPFEPLISEKGLDDWDGDFKLWTLKDGVITGDSPGISHNSFLATRQQFGDFELKLEFRLRGGVGNSGIQFRSVRVPGSTEVSGYQADIGENYWGCLYDESRRNRILAQTPPAALAAVKRDDWNEYTIKAHGARIQHALNGVTTVDYTEEDTSIARTGFIALQVHSGGPLKIEFRNLQIRKL